MPNPAPTDTPEPDYANVPYGPHARNVLDFWRSRSGSPSPLVVYFHGGGFRGGDKSSLPQTILLESLKAGLAVATVNYRLSDTAAFPAFMHDAGRAIQFMRSKSEAWNIRPDRIAATGESAGGGISLWLGFHPDLADPESGDPVARESTRLTCLGAYYTQCSYDPRFFRKAGLHAAADHIFMLPFYGLSEDRMDTPEAHRMFEEAAPMNWFQAGGPPVFLYYPQDDGPLPPYTKKTGSTWEEIKPLADSAVHHPLMGKLVKERLDALGVECELHLNVGDRIPRIQADMVQFLMKHLSD